MPLQVVSAFPFGRYNGDRGRRQEPKAPSTNRVEHASIHVERNGMGLHWLLSEHGRRTTTFGHSSRVPDSQEVVLYHIYASAGRINFFL